VTDPVPEDLTDEDLILLWRALSAEARKRLTAAIVDEIVHPKGPPKKRGPRPAAAAKARQIARRWTAYPAARIGGSINAHGAKFLKSLPEPLRPKLTGRGGHPGAKNLYRRIKQRRDLNRERVTPLRRLAAALRAIDRSSLAVRGSRKTRPDLPEDLADLERSAGESEQQLAHVKSAFYQDSAARALLGDDAVDAQSFIRMRPKK
jgi:hypothetical protein